MLCGYFLYRSLPRQRIPCASPAARWSATAIIRCTSCRKCCRRAPAIASASDANITMARLSRGEALDLALMQDADAERYPNIRHIATPPTQVLCAGAATNQTIVSELRNRQINLEPRRQWREHAVQALEFAGLHSGRPSGNQSGRRSLYGAARQCAAGCGGDRVVHPPRPWVSFLIRYGYTLLELPFPGQCPASPGLGQPASFPPLPTAPSPHAATQSLLTVGSSLHLAGHDRIDARATRILLHHPVRPGAGRPPAPAV